MFKLMAGIDIIHIPYKGPAAAVTDLLAGQVQMYFENIGEPRTILAFGSGCSARAEVSPRSGTVLTPGRRPRGPLHDATRQPPVSALKRVQLPSARAEPAGGCCSRGSSCRS